MAARRLMTTASGGRMRARPWLPKRNALPCSVGSPVLAYARPVPLRSARRALWEFASGSDSFESASSTWPVMDALELELKHLLIEVLNLEDITVDQIDSDVALFGDGLGLDSIDALELGVAIRRKYDVQMDADSEITRAHFASIASLARFIREGRRDVPHAEPESVAK